MIKTIEFNGEDYPLFQAEGFASKFAFPFALEVCKGVGLDIGCAKKEWALPGAIPIDKIFNDNCDAMNLPDIIAKKEEKTVRVEDLDPASVEVYVRRFSRVAVAEMRKFGMPASIKLALGILESRAGDGVDPQDNNHFGAPLAGESYVSAWENWRAHSLLMKRNYADLFDNAYGYKQWAKGLAQKGYSADRKYADRLISIVEKYQLHLYDE